MLIPREPVPVLNVPTLAHGAFDLLNQTPQNFSLIVFFRGLHYPLYIKSQLSGRFHNKINWLLLGGFSSFSTAFATS